MRPTGVDPSGSTSTTSLSELFTSIRRFALLDYSSSKFQACLFLLTWVSEGVMNRSYLYFMGDEVGNLQYLLATAALWVRIQISLKNHK
jgi:hypothetical protein